MSETDSRRIILTADPADARDIYELQLAAYATEALLYDSPIPPVVQSWESAEADFPRWHVLKLVEDGRIAGSIRGRMEDGACQIAKLMVHPDARGRGHGAALLGAVEEAFPGVPYELFTGDRSRFNIDMYLRHGYRILRTDPDAGLVFFRKDGQAGT
ncbi:MAG: GNAT family N-acetyltransferase [Clostridia bacterium]|nr:GNAT family N-acetyltransferase [Clostridia bacterium]